MKDQGFVEGSPPRGTLNPPNRGRFHCGRDFIRRYTKDARDMTLRGWGKIVRRDHRHDFVPIIIPSPCAGRNQQNDKKNSANQHR